MAKLIFVDDEHEMNVCKMSEMRQRNKCGNYGEPTKPPDSGARLKLDEDVAKDSRPVDCIDRL